MSEYRIESEEITGYERQLDGAQLAALAANVTARTGALLSQGVPIPIDQMNAHHVIGLLESLTGPDEALRVKEWHLTWLDRQLDAVEAQMRANLLASGLLDGDGRA